METIKNYWEYIMILILVLLLLNTCSEKNSKKTEIKQLNEQLKQSITKLSTFREKQTVLFDSIFLAEKIKNEKIKKLQKSNTDLEKQLINSHKKLEQRKQTFRNKNYEQLAEVFREIGYKDVTATNNSVNLEKDSPIEILDNLAEGDNCFYDLKMKNNLLKNKDLELKLTQEKVLSRDLQLASKQFEVYNLEENIEISREINEKQEDENKKLKRKNFITTYIIPPLAFLAGMFIAK